MRRLIKEYNGPEGQNTSQAREQSFVTNDAFLQQGLTFGCFDGYALSEEKIGNKVALTKASSKNSENIVYATSTDRPGFFDIVVKDKSGNIVLKSVFDCQNITNNGYAKLKLRDDQQRTIDPLLKSGRYKSPDDISATPDQWDFITAYEDSDVKERLGNTLRFLDKNTVLWKKKSALTQGGVDTESRLDRILKDLKSKQFKTENEFTSESEKADYIKCDLANTTDGPTKFGNNCYKYSNMQAFAGSAEFFKPGYTIYMPKQGTTTAPKTADNSVGQYQYFCNAAKTSNFSKDSCYNCILQYYYGARNGAGTAPDPGYKEMVESCLSVNQEDFKKLSNLITYLKGIGMPANQNEWAIANKSYKLAKQGGLFGGGKLKVNEDIKIKKIIRESLYKVKNNKKELITESKIVKNRLEILAEGRDLRKKKNLDIFFNRFLNETAYLNTRGYDKRVINEQFWNMLSNFFGGTGMDSVFQYFKEYAAKWLLGKFGIDPNTWIGSAITVAVGNVNIGDIPKLTNCDYVVPLIAKSLLETLLKKFLASKKFDNAITDILRNVFVELIDNLQFVKSLEDNLAKLVCPWIKELGNKMSSVTNNLTQKSSNAPEVGNLLSSTTNQLNQGLNKTANQLIDRTQ